MDRIRVLIKSFGKKRRYIFAALALILLLTAVLSSVAAAQASQADKQEIIRDVAQKWIQVGAEQYRRGFYRAAEQSYLRARDYERYLTAAEREKLQNALEKTHVAVLERERILEHIQTADELEKRGELAKARAHLSGVKESEFLTEAERNLITEGLAKIDSRLAEKQLAEKAELTAAVEAKRQKPDVGMAVEQAKTDEPALETVKDELLVEPETVAEAEPQIALIEPVAKEPAPVPAAPQEQAAVAVAEPVTPESGYIEVIERRRNILRSHTRAVVNDAVAKAQDYIAEGRFDKAKKEVVAAERIVNKNRLHLGDELFGQYSGQLEQLDEKIVQLQTEQARQLQEQKYSEATEAQRRYREQMELDRVKRIAELMENATACQKQQRYEEALGQLESLLVLDPLNDRALILKQTLEDTVNFRKQLEVQKQADKERAAILIRTDESAIPYAEELVYPKNWREIVANRKPEEAIGQDPADIAVYKQLEEIVDLSELMPEMPLSEAIEELKSSVEPSLKIVVLWRDLYDSADIDQATLINMDAISGVPLGRALELLLKSVSGGFAELGYVVEGGVITVATIESLPSELETLVYDVTDLLGRPADFYAKSGGAVTADAESAGAEGFEEEDEMDRSELAGMATVRAGNLVLLIQDTVEPDSWYDAGGEGMISIYENKKLVVRQSRNVHNEIAKLLKEMRKALGQQVSIEARFLLVGENFLEDIGLDIDFTQLGAEIWEDYWVEKPDYQKVYGTPIPNPDWDPDNLDEMIKYGILPYLTTDKKGQEPARKESRVIVEGTGEKKKQFVGYSDKFRFIQEHYGYTWPDDTGILGSWGSLLRGGGYGALTGMELGFGGMILDTLQVDLLLRATQAHRDAKSLTAPKVTVLSGESASLRVQRIMWYPTDPEFDIEEIGEEGRAFWTVEYEDASIATGTLLNVTPTITSDKKNVILNIVTELRDFLGWTTHTLQGPIMGGGESAFTIRYPETEISRVETRVSIPDGGTLLLGGQKLTAEIEKESGVPVLSKIPIIGRAFSNRSKVKDEKILLILVQPTIILQEEAEAKAIAAMR